MLGIQTFVNEAEQRKAWRAIFSQATADLGACRDPSAELEALLGAVPGIWSALCQFFLKLAPLASQEDNARAFFCDTYDLRYGSVDEKQQAIARGLTYAALAAKIEQLREQKEFAAALTHATDAAHIYRTPGYFLLADVLSAQAKAIAESAAKRPLLIQALAWVKVGQLVENQSMIALQNADLNVAAKSKELFTACTSQIEFTVEDVAEIERLASANMPAANDLRESQGSLTVTYRPRPGTSE